MNRIIQRCSKLTVVPEVDRSKFKTNADFIENTKSLQNRNPRNLELLRIARKPTGWHLEKPGREFWHKLVVHESSRYVTAEIIHFENRAVVTASTKEWALKKQLYKTKDGAAYLNLGRVLAQRCLESGIPYVRCDLKASECEKIQLLLSEVQKGGVALEEPDRYIHAAPWDWKREQKPWEVND
ncbi:39S ribosomal protein L18, mitochondrial [Venturia canescens]|uniref:39S ribosomal protein L18, mitochondrial n=1 Tax=Venturia canescens TaxID=32260 RepID=UPI001C9BD063|nr:39S ribosomal protein L18, mitochondrial [Venturia canescens]